MALQLHSLNAAVSSAVQLQKELNALHTTTKRAFARLEETSAFTVMKGSWRNTLLLVYTLTNDYDVANDYCYWIRCNWPGENYTGWTQLDEMSEFIRKHVVPGSQWKQWAEPQHADQLEHFRAAQYLAEYRTFVDLAQLNAKGITPPAHVIVELLESNFAVTSRGARADAWFQKLALERWARDFWLRQFRKKWSVGFKTLPQRPPLAKEDIIYKDQPMIT